MAMGRTRSKARAGWPDNLYPNRDGFKYRNPKTGKEVWLGRDKAKAFETARQANALLVSPTDLLKRVVAARESVADAVRIFRQDDAPGRGWKESTAAEYEIVLRRIEKDIGDREVATFTVKDCAEYIRQADGARGRNTRRLVLTWVFACALQEGWIEFNPAEQTRKFTFERQRQRLTKQAYGEIWAKAPAWVRNAMDLSLITLLRRDDVVGVRFADLRDNALWIVPAKTDESTLVKLQMKATPALLALAARCRDEVLSPYLIHRLPEKARPSNKRAKGRDHHTQVMADQLTRAFKEARDAAGITGPTAPTFHEIRSLGGALLRTECGWTEQQVQELMGHASPSMTQNYLEGHEMPWQEVTPGLSLPA